MCDKMLYVHFDETSTEMFEMVKSAFKKDHLSHVKTSSDIIFCDVNQ
jgi:hypothetical protein